MNVRENYVHIKVDRESDELLLNNGETLYIDPTFDPTKHEPSSGKVLGICDSLFFTEDPKNLRSVNFDVDIEVEPGDTVVFNYKMRPLAESYGAVLDDGTFFLTYDKLYLAFGENKEIRPLNGQVIVEPIEEEVKTIVELPDHMKRHKSNTKGYIRYIGKPVRKYREWPDFPTDNDDLKVGDLVYFSERDCIPLQYSLHQSVDKGTTLYRMLRKDIVAKPI